MQSLLRHRSTYRLLVGLVVLTAGSIANSLVPSVIAEELSEAEFQTLWTSLQPEPDQPWRTIPWRISLLEAQAAAAEQGKPIFIWAMDGHPLGCT